MRPVVLRVLVLMCLFLVPTVLATAEMAEAEEKKPSSKDCFHRFEAAWGRGDAAGVAACMSKTRKLKVFLRVPGASSSLTGWSSSQAKRGLEQYFAKKVTSIRLVDVTKKEQRGTTVRLYDYHYRLRGGEEQVTRLTVTLSRDTTGGKTGGWTLDRIQESFRPAAPRRMIGSY